MNVAVISLLFFALGIILFSIAKEREINRLISKEEVELYKRTLYLKGRLMKTLDMLEAIESKRQEEKDEG